MSTTFFPIATSSAAVLPAAFTGTKKLLSLTRGAGVQTQTDNTIASLSGAPGIGNTQSWGGATAAISPRNGLLFITKPLFGSVVGGSTSFTLNMRALESNAKANYSVGFQLWRISSDGLTATECLGYRNSGIAELGTSEAATNLVVGNPTTFTIADGEYLVAIFQWITGGGTSASGNTASGLYAGASGLTGDTFITFADTITELTVSDIPSTERRTPRRRLLQRL